MTVSRPRTRAPQGQELVPLLEGNGEHKGLSGDRGLSHRKTPWKGMGVVVRRPLGARSQGPLPGS